MLVLGGCVAALVLSMTLVQPTYAAEPYDPSDRFTGLPTNADVQAIFGTNVPGTNCYPANTCNQWIVFAGSGYVNLGPGPGFLPQNPFVNVTCIVGYTSSTVHTLNVNGNGFLTPTATGQPHCYRAGAWVTTQQALTHFVVQTPEPIVNADISRENVNCGNVLQSGYGLGSVACNGLLWGENDSMATLEATTTGPYVTGQQIQFQAEWAGVDVNPYYLYFYEDIEETVPVRVVNNYPVGNSGTWSFQHAFAFGGSYHSFYVLGNSSCTTVTSTGAITGAGCVTYTSDVADTLEVVSPSELASDQDAYYRSTFSADKTQDVIVGETVAFEYNLSSNFCSGSSVSGKRLFKGYPSSLSYLDPGTVLASGLTGSSSLVFDRTAQPYSDFYYPSILVYCANATSHRVYLGGSVIVQNAQGISVYNANDLRFAMPSTWLGGGVSTESGATYRFQSDKRLYRPGEPVKLVYSFRDVPFTVTQAFLFDNDDPATLLRTLTGSWVSSGNHYLTISYASVGEYNPLLVLANTGAVNTRSVFLGGTSQPTYNSLIAVTQQGSPLYVNTGALLGQYGGTGGTVNTNGIFALDFKIGWGTTGNVYLDTVQGILSPVMYALWWISQKAYSVLSATPLFSFLFDIIYPPDGSCYTFPDVIFDFPGSSVDIQTPEALSGTEFCVDYTTNPNSQNLTKVLYAVMSITVMFWAINMFIPNKEQ